MEITKETKVGEIATVYPLATRVFSRHNIDFCCGGGIALNDACTKKNLNPDLIITELETEISQQTNDEKHWENESLSDLIDHILVTYHRPLDEELPRLEQMVRKVNEVHGEKDPEMFSELLSVYLRMKNELDGHMIKEEQILFPMIKQGQGAGAGGPINVMLMEHESAGDALKTFRKLTDNYTVPDEACNTWRALWVGLEALEDSLHMHIHLENNILFPRALKEG